MARIPVNNPKPISRSKKKKRAAKQKQPPKFVDESYSMVVDGATLQRLFDQRQGETETNLLQLAHKVMDKGVEAWLEFILSGGEFCLARMGLDWSVTQASAWAAFEQILARIDPESTPTITHCMTSKYTEGGKLLQCDWYWIDNMLFHVDGKRTERRNGLVQVSED